jgi:hypothetical protein
MLLAFTNRIFLYSRAPLSYSGYGPLSFTKAHDGFDFLFTLLILEN